MPKNEALQDLKNELHVSHSQLATYLNCSLKYRFMYGRMAGQQGAAVEGREGFYILTATAAEG